MTEKYNIKKLDDLSLELIHAYFLAIRAINFPIYEKSYRELDLDFFINLADDMENLVERKHEQFLYSEIIDINDTLNTLDTTKYSTTVQDMVLNMKNSISNYFDI